MNLKRSQIFREASEKRLVIYICQTARENVYYGGTADVLSFDTDIWSILCGGYVRRLTGIKVFQEKRGVCASNTAHYSLIRNDLSIRDLFYNPFTLIYVTVYVYALDRSLN